LKRAHFLAVSLFSNCGAGDLGYARAGFEFLVMAEIRKERLAVALRNHPKAKGVPGDLRETWGEVVSSARAVARRPLDLLAACPPCQGMSSAKTGRGSASNPDEGSRDARNLLVIPIANVAQALCPRMVVVENVTAFLSRQVRHPKSGCGVTAAALLVEMLSPSYEVYPLVAELADYGVPQRRRRAFLTFIRRGEPCLARLRRECKGPYPRPRTCTPGWRRTTLEEALKAAALPSLDARSTKAATDPQRPLHRVPTWCPRRYAMVAAIPSRSGASAWQNSVCEACGPVQVGSEDVVCPSCGRLLPRPVVPDVGGGWRLIRGHRRSSYRRMHPDRPCATVTTASGKIGSDFTLHPWENRVLSPLECALLQTFPADFQWEEGLGVDAVREMIGEAVPPLFTELHGRELAALLSGRVPEDLASYNAARGRKIWAKLYEAPEDSRVQILPPLERLEPGR
jgi:DNA (cytosine-5)-methyltransferase 1